MIDLHTHSTASDGSLSPSELINEAKKRELSAIALTDHDTLGGLQEAARAAEALGIRFIPGIEIEIGRFRTGAGEESRDEAPGPPEIAGEFHLLGLGISRPSGAFLDQVAGLSRRREARNREILDRMHELSIDASYEEIQALAGGHSVGRPHFAAFLVERRITKNREQAFARYLGKGKPFYVPTVGMDFEKALSGIKESGGIAVLAHPMSLYVAWGRLPELIQSLKDRGLDGLEAWHPTAKVSTCRRLEELALSLGLLVTAGSDFHGEARPDRRLGITAGGKKIDRSFLAAVPLA
jgi:predicted metal-dependent phosphoesterase TrpH